MLLEGVRLMFTKITSRLRDVPYEYGLSALGLPSLRHLRFWVELMETFRRLKCIEGKNPFVLCSDLALRGHSLNLKKPSAANMSGQLSPQRVNSTWNNLPDEVIHIPAVDQFKADSDSMAVQSPNRILWYASN